MHILKPHKLFTLFLVWTVTFLSAQPIRQPAASEIQLALKKLNVLGSVLYVGAHPDDENTAVLAYFSNDRLLHTAYLSMTRGSGGQNLIGKEKDELLGILRTRELLAARRIDGARQFFTRAIDFGYSRAPEETIDIWNRKKILADIVWVIRKFRPDIIINRFTPERGGHGHHLASAILTLEAFRKAGDPTVFPEQLKYMKPWQPKRVFWDVWRWGNSLEKIDTSQLSRVDVGKYNPFLGESYTEMAARSRSMHKSQGFGASSRRGTFREYFQLLAGDSVREDPMSGINVSWSRVPGSQTVQAVLSRAYREFQPENPAAVLPTLIGAYREMQTLPQNHRVQIKRQELKDLIGNCAGLWLEAQGTDYFVSPGRSLQLDITALNRSDYPFRLTKIDLPYGNPDTVLTQKLPNNESWRWETTIRLPDDVPYSQPYWLEEPPARGTYRVTAPDLRGLPEGPPPLTVGFTLSTEHTNLVFTVPVRYRWTDPVEGENYRDVEIVPPVVAEFEQKVYVFPDNNPKEIRIKLKSTTGAVSGNLKLLAPDGWTVEPASTPFKFSEKGTESTHQFTVHPSRTTGRDTIRAVVESGGKTFTNAMHQIDYPHIPIQTAFSPALAKLLRIDLNRSKKTIGYIMGPGDDIPQSLRQLGYQVAMLSPKEVETGDLSRYDAIVTGIRAYNTNPWLKNDNRLLLEYVQNGGTLLMQYNVTRGLILDSLGPYPFELSHDRVTVEEAPVTFVEPDHLVLNRPNKITKGDFANWVQERGLYFAAEWDDRYQPVLSSHDPGEPPCRGGLLFARYGKGVYIYTGYSFFRQLPAGVPGAFKLFVNLIESGRANE